MQRNVAGQKVVVFAFDATTNLPVSGDAANITASVSKDYGTVTDLADTSAAEMDPTKATGYYLFDLAQAETDGDTLLFSARSLTANVVVIGVPATVFTTAPNFSSLAVTALGTLASHDPGTTLGTSTLTAADVLTTALTESYAAVGVAPTLSQAVFEMVSLLCNRAVVGTTLTNYKMDGTTPAMTFTLDSATQPTTQTRAS